MNRIRLLVLVMVTAGILTGCDGCDDGFSPQSITYTGRTSGGDTYHLEITENLNRAVYAPQTGDTYKLTLLPGNKISTGTIGTITVSTNTTITLNSDKTGTITITLSNGGISAITGSGVTWNDNSSITAASNLTPIVGTPITAPATNGKLTLHGLSSYVGGVEIFNGKWVIAVPQGDTQLFAVANYSGTTTTPIITGAPISNGSATLKVWRIVNDNLVAYSGSDKNITVKVMILTQSSITRAQLESISNESEWLRNASQTITPGFTSGVATVTLSYQ